MTEPTGIVTEEPEMILDDDTGHGTSPDTPKIRAGFGCLKGLIMVPDDFDAPLEDFKDYM